MAGSLSARGCGEGSLGGAQDGEDHDFLQALVHVAGCDREDVDAVRVLLRRQRACPGRAALAARSEPR